MGFKQLGLQKELLHALDDLGYKQPTSIQEEAVPYLLRRRDLLAIAKTGTGKTAAFALPLLQQIKENKDQNTVCTKLIIAPTRELVLQLEKDICSYAKYLDVKIGCVYGGANIKPQIKMLQNKVDMVIATSGRLIDLIEQDHISLAKIDTLVLDEADSMLDMGFIEDITKIIASSPRLEQKILCSATLGSHVKKLSHEILKNPKVIEVKANDKVNKNIEQISYPVEDSKKMAMLSFLIGSKNMKQVLVFCKTKALADALVEHLKLDGLKALAVHGGKTHGARKKAIESFKEQKVQVLVATDVAARGLDIQDLFFVINYDLPFTPTDYVHRIGRTARAGKDGIAISLLDQYDMATMQEIEKFLKVKVPRLELDGFAVDKKIKMISKKSIIKSEKNTQKTKTSGAFGKKKAKKESQKMPKIRGKRIIGQKRKTP
jgi:ATP-dependent RNA helicase RhlE